MSFNITAADQEQPKLNLQIDHFEGVNLLVKDARTKQSEAVEALNLYQVEDGVWTPRPGTGNFGTALPGNSDSIINGAAEYVTTNRSNEEVRAIVAIIDGVPYTSGDDARTWTMIEGAQFNETARIRFIQLGGQLFIFNGIDPLAVYDGEQIIVYEDIEKPTNLQATRGSDLSDGNYTQYYQVTAVNEVGETEASTEVSIRTNKERDTWSASNGECINLTWDAIPGAVGYQVYWSDLSGHENLLGRVPTNSFCDDATYSYNPFVDTPDDNTTGAPIFSAAWISDNAIYATGDAQNPYRVYRTGTGVNLGKFSSFYDGFWIDLELGGREKPKAGRHYQSGSGEGRSTIFCSTPEGRGSVWQIVVETSTVGEDAFPTPSAYKIIGSVGTDSIDGVINVENDVFFPNKQGVYALGPEKNYFGILRTNNLATLIIEYWRSLSGNKVKDIASYYWSNKVLISVSTNGKTNNRTVVYDRERLRWYADWSIGFKQFFEFTDNGGTSHLIGIHESGNQLTEISDKIKGDLGESFKCVYMSGRIPLDKNWNEFAKVKKAYIKLGRVRGEVLFTVYGTQKKKGYTALTSRSLSSTTSNSGISWDSHSGQMFSSTFGLPFVFADSSEIHYLKVNKKLRDIQFRVESNQITSEWTLLGLKAKGFKISTSDPSTWKLKKS